MGEFVVEDIVSPALLLAAGMKATSFPGFSPCSVGWIGENPGNEVGMKVACSRRQTGRTQFHAVFCFWYRFFQFFVVNAVKWPLTSRCFGKEREEQTH